MAHAEEATAFLPVRNPDAPEVDTHREKLDGLVRAHGVDVVGLVQAIHELFGFLPRNALEHAALALDIPLARLYGIATFFTRFSLVERGKHIIRVCDGTACHVAGSDRITEALTEHLELDGSDTTEDRMFTLDVVACVGCCSLAPVVNVGAECHGRLDKASAVACVERLRAETEPTE